jgi:hypothetical protein
MGLNPSEYDVSESVELYGLEQVRPYHREIARRLVLGQRPSEIAKDLGWSVSRLSIIINSPLFKMEIARLEQIRDTGVADVGKTLKELSPIALETVERIMYQSKSERLKLEAAETVLDRAGYGTINKVDVKGSVVHNYHNYTKEELQELVKDRLERMRQEQLEREKLLNNNGHSDSN